MNPRSYLFTSPYLLSDCGKELPVDLAAPEAFEIVIDRIRAALAENRQADAVNIFKELHPADQAGIFNLLDENEQGVLLPLLDIPTTAIDFGLKSFPNSILNSFIY